MSRLSWKNKRQFKRTLLRLARGRVLRLVVRDLFAPASVRRQILREAPIDASGEEAMGMEAPEIPDCGLDPHSRQQETEALSKAISALNPRLRKAIELQELGELSTKETSQQMGLSIAATKSRTFYGKRKLRHALRRLRETSQSIQPITIGRMANRAHR